MPFDLFMNFFATKKKKIRITHLLRFPLEPGGGQFVSQNYIEFGHGRVYGTSHSSHVEVFK